MIDNDSDDNLETLMASVALRDRAAFAELYRRGAPRLLTLARAVTGSTALAEEALQEAFVQIWYAAPDYRADKGAAMAWLASVVRHRALDLQRRERSQQRRAAAAGIEALTDPVDRADTSALDRELRELLDCLQKLPEAQRRSLLAAYYHGYSHSEIATREHQPLGTVKSWVRRGMASIRVCLGL